MIENLPNFHQRARLDALQTWARNGVLTTRQQLPIERDFARRVAEKTSKFFIPLELGHVDDVIYHREVSYLIDALDQLPARPDVAFDSIFKAFEATARRVTNEDKATHAFLAVPAHQDFTFDTVSDLFSNLPAQTCEYLYKRLSAEMHEWPTLGKLTNPVLTRMRSTNDQDLSALLEVLKIRRNKYQDINIRQEAMFLRKVLLGEEVTGDHPPLKLPDVSRAHLLISGLLYTARNERFHGQSFSPFVSSQASISTYVHPYFLFVATYALLMNLWTANEDHRESLSVVGVKQNTESNLELGREIFGRHWMI